MKKKIKEDITKLGGNRELEEILEYLMKQIPSEDKCK